VRVPALSGRRRLTGRLVLSSHLSHDEEEKDDVGLVLLTSHLSHDVARPALLLLLLLPSEELLLASQCSAASARQGLGGDLVGALLHASHLSTASARLGFGGEGAAAQGGVGSSGNIFHSGGVGRSPDMAACAMARCTRATVTAMGGAVDGSREKRGPALSSTATQTRSEEAEAMECD
jgi:hypothetical protein